MALTFPSSPTNGQVFTDPGTGNRYVYDASKGLWKYSSNNVGVTVGTAPPPINQAAPGAMWYNTNTGRTFILYDDGDSKQWVENIPAPGNFDSSTVAGYANAATLLAVAPAFNKANAALANTNAVSFSGSLYFPTGSVGIGTSSPSYTLDVVGKSRTGYQVAQGTPNNTDITANAHTLLSGTGGNYLAIGQYDGSGSYGQWIQSTYVNPSTTTYNLILNPLGGNVGIGTPSPAQKLEVLGSGDTFLRVTGGSANAKGVEFYKGSGSASQIYNVSDDLRVFTGGANSMTIDSSGRVSMPRQPAFLADTVTGGWAGWTADQVFIFTNVYVNTGSCYSASTGRFTAQVAGNYYFTASAYMQGNSVSGRIAFVKNGSYSYYWLSHKSNSGDGTLTVSAVIPLATNDYIDFRNVSYSINIYTGGAHTYFSGHLIG